MTKRDVLSVALKIMGVYCLFTAIVSIPTIGFGISMATQVYGEVWMLITSIMYPIWLIGFAYVFIQFSEVFAEKLIPEDTQIPSVDMSQLEKPIFVLAVRIIGVISLARGVPELVKFIVLSPTWRYEAMTARSWENMAGGIALLGFGIYLLSGGKQLVAFAFKEKTKPDPLDEPSDEDKG
jgi:hypothetical protein